jgi:RHS repeat-associated protein
MGEKFAANPVTGTGSMSVPIATSPGRGGFGPQLSLSYDSAAGNGPFGFGWSLSLPAITRKTDKGLPRYQDGQEQGPDSDVFILSGAEDLVPVYRQDQDGSWVAAHSGYQRDLNGFWVRDRTGQLVIHEDERDGYRVRRYGPRIEGLFARIERWTNSTDPGDTFWRSISKDNITTWYGKTRQSRITDPSDPTHSFSWLICESYDDKGNAIVYEYKPEDSADVNTSQANDRNRVRTVNRYLKRIKYGNRVSRLVQPDLTQASWMFEVVFDYGDHDLDVPLRDEAGRQWRVRQDPFSSYRAGFEVRTYRLCRRVLMFHHFTELGVTPCLVRSTDLHHAQSPVGSFLTSVAQSGYKRKPDGTYLKNSLPPVEFTYSKATIQEQVHEVDAASLENLPQGLDNSRYQWVDLDGEGLSGILTEQGGAWFYKRNQSAVPVRDLAGNETTRARFAPLECVATMPSSSNLSGGQQLLDLAGDGQLDVVDFEGATPGVFERTADEEWDTHKPFTSLPNIAWRDPNLKFIDLTGDGHADILITEDQAFSWYPSLAESGFGPGERVRQAIDEEQGPRLVFADGTQSIYLADMSGDGLTDLVRIRNGAVCYWPNLGYGRFGAKVTMDHAPWFDAPDLFDQRRIRLADIDGSGLVDILYLTGQGVQLYFNQSGNAWSERRLLTAFPRIDNLSSVSTVDLLGNGTACLAWSSPLPGEARSTIRYIDLMGGQKPHLLIKTKNNLGAETEVTYAPSTKFYLEDKQAGKPWITKLPFPVHCVEKVTVRDIWRQTEFASTYSYHHGYFDGIEREFRGFGRVEQRDVETYGKFMQGNAASPYITDDHTLYQPPIKTVTWYHTGAAFDRHRILSAFKDEYYPIRGFTEHQLSEPTLTPTDLSAEEWREAVRACKGMVLRQEVFELDVDALAQEKEVPVRLYTTAYHNSTITRLQPQGINRHAVFLVTESEAITYSYELDLRQTVPNPDPRIAHTLNLQFDAYGRALQSVAVVYPRLVPYEDTANLLNQGQRDIIRNVQSERHIAYTETHFTDELPEDQDRHRLPVPCEALTYELSGSNSTNGFSPGAGLYFSLDDLRGFALSQTLPDQGPRPVVSLAYHEQPADERAHKRLVEWVRMLYWKDDLTGPEPFGTNAWLGLAYETYKLALSRDLLGAVFGSKLTPEVFTALNTTTISGYTAGTALSAALTNQWWIRSGVAGFTSDAAQHFYLPERYTDPFGSETTLQYDGKYDLFIQSSADALGNTTGIATERTNPADPATERPRFDYRVLAPIEMVDANGNRSEVAFDILGMVVASAVKGKGTEGDDLTSFDDVLANPSAAAVQAFCTDRVMNEQTARTWLNRATARFVYHFGESRDAQGRFIRWEGRPAGACGILRERHASKVALDPLRENPLQVSLECSDGGGNVLMKKVQAEPVPGQTALRWIVNGLTVLNNKGKPVKQYEPAFSADFGCELPQANGVTPIMYYEAAGRVVRTEMPDGTFSRVEFSPWHVKTFDANDTVLESQWYAGRTPLDPTQPLPRDPVTGEITATPDQRAAWLAAQHANTPAQVHLDSLGREVITIAHNRTNGVDERYVTFTKLDAEGKPLWIRDARGNLVMQYITPAKANNDASNAMPANAVPCYDIAGNLLYQHSMDAGDRWMLMDAAGKPMLAWDINDKGAGTPQQQRTYRTEYDALHRPVKQWLTVDSNPPALVEAFEYLDTSSFKNAQGVIDQAALRAAQGKNLIGQAVKHWDPSGLATVERIDLSGKPAHITRRLIKPDADGTTGLLGWPASNRENLLDAETFHQITEYDALGRMTKLYNWHRDINTATSQSTPGATDRVSVYVPQYNERGALKSEWLHVRAAKNTDTVNGKVSFTPSATPAHNTQAIQEITYNAKGQKEILRLDNGTTTTYTYDDKTFRLTSLRTLRATAVTDLQDLQYTYDPVGNITHIHDAAQATVFHSNTIIRPEHHYVYDALYRLLEGSGRENPSADAPPKSSEGAWPQGPIPTQDVPRNYTQRYVYDAVGNFVEMEHRPDRGTGWTRRYAYAFDDPGQPASNRLWRTWYGSNTWDGSRTDSVTYRYDTHGNMLNLANVAPGQYLQWDHRDMIKSLDLVGGGIAHYQYDAGKQRTRKYLEREVTNPDDTKRWVRDWERIYLGGYELYRRIVAGAVVEEIESHHLFEGEQRVLLVDDVLKTDRRHTNGTPYKTEPIFRYQYSNHLGSACVELDHQAEIISYEEYHPYGTSAYRAMKSGIEAPPKRYRYTGMERDEESGLGYHVARCHASWLGMWITADPMGLADGPNLYAYSGNNPMRFVDTQGHQATTTQKTKEQDAFDAAKKAGYDSASVENLIIVYVEPVARTKDHLLNIDVLERYIVVRGEAFSANWDQGNRATALAHLTIGLIETFGTPFAGKTDKEVVQNTAKIYALSAIFGALGAKSKGNQKALDSSVERIMSGNRLKNTPAQQPPQPPPPEIPPEKYPQTFAEWIADKKKNPFSVEMYEDTLKPLVTLLEKLGPEIKKAGVDPKDIHVNPYKGGTGGGFILASGEIALDVEALTRLQGAGLTAAESAEAVLWHEVAHKILGHFKNLGQAGEIVYSAADEIAADRLGAGLTKNPKVQSALLDHASQPK